jgi:hypothetical protein
MIKPHHPQRDNRNGNGFHCLYEHKEGIVTLLKPFWILGFISTPNLSTICNAYKSHHQESKALKAAAPDPIRFCSTYGTEMHYRLFE